MVQLLEQKRAALIELCDRFGVSRLDVFGSALGDDFRPAQSDLDLLVEFRPMGPHELADSYFGLLGEIRSLLGLEIDLVVAGAVKNRFIAADIERTKREFYAA
jgi:predicted nucleotidyltransferase